MMSRAAFILVALGSASVAAADVDAKGHGSCSFKIDMKKGVEEKTEDVDALLQPWMDAITPGPAADPTVMVSCRAKNAQLSFGLAYDAGWKSAQFPMKAATYKVGPKLMYVAGTIYATDMKLDASTGELVFTEFDATHAVGTFKVTSKATAQLPKGDKAMGTATITGTFSLTAPKKK